MEPSERRKKDSLTILHQWMTILLAPIFVLFLGWFVHEFDAMRFDVHDLQHDMALVKSVLGISKFAAE